MLIISSLENSSPFGNMLLTSTICKRWELNSVLAKMKTTASSFIVVLCLSGFIYIYIVYIVSMFCVCLTCFNILQILRFYQRKVKVNASLLLISTRDDRLSLHKRLFSSYILRFYKAFLKESYWQFCPIQISLEVTERPCISLPLWRTV